MDRKVSRKTCSEKTTMNCNTRKTGSQRTQFTGRHITMRLDESIPLETEDWKKVEQISMRLTEFAPRTLVTELLCSVAEYADDQARRGYILGQEDLMQELVKELA